MAKNFLAICLLLTGTGFATVFADEPFRPEPGKFPPLEKSKSYKGELVFVDYPNRRGSFRVPDEAEYFRNKPQPFAMLPYGIVRYRGAPADLRDIPLGTVMNVRAFLPPDPKISAVPVISNASPSEPAENHVILLEDEPSYCMREGKTWKLKELDLQKNQGIIVGSLELKEGGGGQPLEQKMTVDAATRIWRGRECLGLEDLIAEGSWPVNGKKSLNGQSVLLGLAWKPTPGAVWNRFHIVDIWLDEEAIQRAAHHQTEVHKELIRTRWMPAWVDSVEYGKFGRATVTATLFGGMDPALYSDFQIGKQAYMNGAENTLKHVGGDYGPAHMASNGSILDVIKAEREIPLGSSGIQIRFETDLIIEAIRPGRIVRIKPAGWPESGGIPRQEYLGDGSFKHEDRFPSPSIFPKY